jgi:hypothetical protein
MVVERTVKKKYIVVFLSASVLEIGSTFYISVVSDKDYLGMMFFAFIGPFLSLPFVGFMVESKTWKERLKLALWSGFGYLIGSLITIIFFEILK